MSDIRCLLLGFIGLLVAPCWGTASTASAADLAEIRETLKEIQTSFGSIRLTWVTRSQSDGDDVDTGSQGDVEFEYLEFGTSKRLTARGPGTIGETVQFFDGKFGYQSFRRTLDGSIESIIKWDTERNELRNATTPLVWFGMPVPGVGKPLYEALENATITGESTHGALPVIDVDFGIHEPIPGHPERRVQVTAKLSPDHDYAPVVFSQQVLDSDVSIEDYVVQTFREVDHPLLQRTISFPHVMTYWTTRIELKSIELNPDVDEAEFVPEPDVGTKIIDKTAGAKAEMHIHGGPEARKRIVGEAKVIVPPANSGVKAVPESSFFTATNCGIFALAAFAIAAFLWKFRST